MALARRRRHVRCMGERERGSASLASLRRPRSARAAALVPSTGARLIVVEAGSIRVDTQALPDGSDHTALVVQNGDERPAQSALRAMRRIRTLERSGHQVQCTLALLGRRFDAEAMAARLALVRALLRHLAATGARSAGLSFGCHGEDLHAGSHAGLRSLLDAVTREPGSWLLRIGIRFAYTELAEPRAFSAN
jgi:hypothetical protein